MATARDTFDVVIDTISAPHDLAPYLKLVAMDGTLSLLGYLGPVTVEAMDLLIGRKKLSSAGGRRPPGDSRDCSNSALTTASPPTSKYSLRHGWTRHSPASGETTSATASCSTCPTWTEGTMGRAMAYGPDNGAHMARHSAFSQTPVEEPKLGLEEAAPPRCSIAGTPPRCGWIFHDCSASARCRARASCCSLTAVVGARLSDVW